MDWEILMPLPITVHTAVTRLVGQNELLIVDIRSGHKKTVTKSSILQDEDLQSVDVDGIGSLHSLPILYIDAEANNYKM